MTRSRDGEAGRDFNDRGLLEAAPAVCAWIDEIPDPDNSEDIFGRARGAMLGLLCGNILGLPVEGQTRDEIEDWWDGEVSDIHPDVALERLDDDAAQAAELAGALLEADGEYLAEAFGVRLVRWFDSNGRGAGGLTRIAIKELRSKDPLEASRAAYAQRPIGPNGALMRCAPAAIAHYRDPAELVRVTALTGAVTHWAWNSQWATVAFNATLARLLRGDERPHPDGLRAALAADGAPDEVIERVAAVPEGVTNVRWLRADEGLIGHSLLGLQAGIWAATAPVTIGDGLVRLVSAGGDTDTNGAIAGAALGARYGESEIPQDWLDALPPNAKSNFGELAERLVDHFR